MAYRIFIINQIEVHYLEKGLYFLMVRSKPNLLLAFIWKPLRKKSDPELDNLLYFTIRTKLKVAFVLILKDLSIFYLISKLQICMYKDK